uniref:CX9C domain-containing protein n=1 Tax=Parastrongyloides trichosuri TaxID=131310 RepID=A0A0N4ZNC6_PARTI
MSNSERYMPSIFKECDKLKKEYDRCFISFFHLFVDPKNTRLNHPNPCADLQNVYRQCVEAKIVKYMI